ncbi:MAG: hypothetical protein R2867_39415 [Caldilineaceae bacterium]
MSIKSQPIRNHSSRLAVSANYMSPLLPPNWSMRSACRWMIRSLITFQSLWAGLKMPIKITLRMMVQHRSGIPNYTNQPGFRWDNPPKTSRESLALVLDLPAGLCAGYNL